MVFENRTPTASYGVASTDFYIRVNSLGDSLNFNTTAEPNYADYASQCRSQITARHLDTTNVLYADGHVKSVKLANLLESKTIATKLTYTNFTIQND